MPAIDEQPEPDEMEPVPVGRELRSGFTTGTSAAAAAVAAGLMLAGKSRPEQVTVMLPGGGEITVAVAESSILNSDEAMAVVVKDGGDDPDVTNGAKIGAIVRRLSKNGQVRIIGGVGVGRVTKAGLALPPGQWAINPTPRR
ncbi:MAG: cobalt-precorrin-5B (C(1))-methyltransferase, partial [Candidatus Adiutrix sp.]|nr:cobalt-precorrin-5B (C(1))-methyltransferase [Candidatus Adiutrix sp.]